MCCKPDFHQWFVDIQNKTLRVRWECRAFNLCLSMIGKPAHVDRELYIFKPNPKDYLPLTAAFKMADLWDMSPSVVSFESVFMDGADNVL